MTVERGRFVGLIGHNCSGKSVLLKLLAGQEMASEGSLRFDSRPIEAWSRRDFARRVAYLL